MRSAALAIMVLLGTPAVAMAQTTGGVPGALDPRGLALGPDGAGLLGVHADTTDYSEGVSCETLPTYFGYVSVRSPAGALSPLKPLGSDIAAGPVRRADGTFAAVLARNADLSGECAPIRQFEFATLDANGAVVARAPLAGPVVAYALRMVGDAIAWIEVSRPPESAEDHYALRLSHAGGPPVTVAQGEGIEPQNPAISDLALIDGLLVWAEPKHVRAVEIGAGGALGRAMTLGPADSVSYLDAEVARGGRAVAAWATQDGGEERNRPLRVYAAVRPRAGARFARARTLSRGHRVDSPQSGVEVAVAPDGRAAVVWGDVVGRDVDRLRYPLYASIAGRTGGLGRARRIVTHGGLLTVGISSRGTALVGFYRGERTYLVRRTPNAKRFTRPATFGRPGPFEFRRGPDGRLLELRVTYRGRAGTVRLTRLRGG